MTKQMVKAAMAVALLAGCGGSAVRGTDEGGGAVASSSQALSMDLRMRAKGADDFQNLLVMADDVKVLADGIEVPVTLADNVVDLADMNNAAKVASFQVPEGTQAVQFEVRLAPAGLFSKGGREGWVNAPGTVLRFTSPLANLVANGKAVLVVDAAKSFVSTDAETLAMVPKFRVMY